MTRRFKNWPDAKKIEVVTTYLALGKAPMVEAITGVPRQTIRLWKMQPWWKDLEREIRNEEDGELDAKLSRIIDKSLDAVGERLDNGEFLLDSRTGQIKRVPVKMRDAARVSTELLDKRNLIRGKPTSITEKISTEDIIKNLAQQFAQFVKNQTTEKIIEGEVINLEGETNDLSGNSVSRDAERVKDQSLCNLPNPVSSSFGSTQILQSTMQDKK